MTVLTQAVDLALRSSFFFTFLIGVLLFGNPGIEFSEITGNSPSFQILFLFLGCDLFELREGEEAMEQ